MTDSETGGDGDCGAASRKSRQDGNELKHADKQGVLERHPGKLAALGRILMYQQQKQVTINQ